MTTTATARRRERLSTWTSTAHVRPTRAGARIWTSTWTTARGPTSQRKERFTLTRHRQDHPLRPDSPIALQQTLHHRPATILTDTGPTTGLPLAPLFPPMPAPSHHCVLTPIDDRGRLADRSPIRALGWSPGQPITISIVQLRVVVISQSNGTEHITRQGYLRLPAHVRHIYRITPGDRLLIAAAPATGVLAVYSMPSLESALLKDDTSESSHETTK